MALVDNEAKRRVLYALKNKGPVAVSALAEDLGITSAAVRQHLATLSGLGLARRLPGPRPARGRPPEMWEVTGRPQGLFPDRHGELSTDLLESIRNELGEDALARVIAARGRSQTAAYKALLRHEGDTLVDRVGALAKKRTDEGYMAEAIEQADGSVLLVEHHCPIAEAAHSCVGLCQIELEAFRRALGAGVTVTRERHLLAGDTRCTYRVVPKPGRSRSPH